MNASRYLIVDPSGVVENIIIYDPQYQFVLPNGYDLVLYSQIADIGWIRNPDGTFAPPQSIEPSQEN